MNVSSGKTRIYIWYDTVGNIKAVGRSLATSKHRILPVMSANTHGVLSVEVETEAVKQLHQTHLVDVRAEKLVARG